jgi:GT2 family glycosyltransferase
MKGVVFEVIIVGNYSCDGKLRSFSKEFSEFKFLMNSANNGFASSCNLGAQQAEGKFLLFLNPDTVITEKALEKLYSVAIENSEYKLISCNKMNVSGKLEKLDTERLIVIGKYRVIWARNQYPFNFIGVNVSC